MLYNAMRSVIKKLRKYDRHIQSEKCQKTQKWSYFENSLPISIESVFSYSSAFLDEKKRDQAQQFNCLLQRRIDV